MYSCDSAPSGGYAGAAPARKGRNAAPQRSNNDVMTRRARGLHGRLDLWSHAPRWKRPPAEVALRLLERKTGERLLIPASVVQTDIVDIGEHHEKIRVNVARDHRRRQVLVDHSF